MSHPDPTAPADLRPYLVGDDLTNPVTGEYAKIIELPCEKVLFTVLAPLAHALGCRGTYPQLSRTIAPRSGAEGPTPSPPALGAVRSP